MRFSLIIPSYNNSEELIFELPLLLSYLSSHNHVVEVIVVNDGSSQTSALYDFCSQNAYRILNFELNTGKGAAVRQGMLMASEEIRIFTDADIPFQYSIFEDILKKFEDEQTKVVCGSRSMSDYFSKTPWYRRIGSGIFSAMVNIIMTTNMGDTQCGIKAFRSTAAIDIFSQSRVNGFAADIEWIFLAKRNKQKMEWVNAEFRNAGQSSVVFWKHAMRMLADVVNLRQRTFLTFKD